MLIVSFTAVCGGLAAAITMAFPTKYTATQTLIVVPGEGLTSNDVDTLVSSLDAVLGSDDFYSRLIEAAGSDLTVESLRAASTTERVPNTGVVDLKVTTGDQDESIALVQAAEPTLDVMLENELDQEAQFDPMSYINFGGILVSQDPKPVELNAMIGAGLGFVTAIAVVALFQYLRPVVRTPEDAEEAFELPVLASLPPIGARDTDWNAHDALFGVLRAISTAGWREPIHRLVVIGPDHDEARAEFLMALGATIANNGVPAVLIDADLENASLSRALELADHDGLAECLAGSAKISEVLVDFKNGMAPATVEPIIGGQGERLKFLPAGVLRDEGLSGMKNELTRVLAGLASERVVVIDAPSVPGPVPSAGMISTADALLVVATESSTLLRNADVTRRALQAVSGKPSAVVLLESKELRIRSGRENEVPNKG